MLYLLLLFFGPSGIPGDELPVSADRICQIQRAIRWKNPPMSEATCEKIAGALAKTATPNLLFAMMINESDIRPHTMLIASETVRDIGAIGIRCVLGARGKCVSGVAAGYTPAQLLDPVVNIALAEKTLVRKRYNLQHYNGGTREHGYQERIRAIMSALAGVLVPSKTPRMKKLTRRIVTVVREAAHVSK